VVKISSIRQDVFGGFSTMAKALSMISADGTATEPMRGRIRFLRVNAATPTRKRANDQDRGNTPAHPYAWLGLHLVISFGCRTGTAPPDLPHRRLLELIRISFPSIGARLLSSRK